MGEESVTMGTELVAISTEESRFNLMCRKAKAFADSTLVPKEYQGNLGNVVVALNMAERLGADPFAVMQSLYIVHGRPSWSAQFVIASVNASGRFTPLRFETRGGDDPAAQTFACRCFATDLASGDVLHGEWITWAMVKAEKWGPKWQTIPGQMFRYRAAAFWARVYCPERLMGFPMSDEAEDMLDVTPKARPADLATALDAPRAEPQMVAASRDDDLDAEAEERAADEAIARGDGVLL